MLKYIGIAYNNKKNLYKEKIPIIPMISLYKDNYKNKYASFFNHDHSTEPIAYVEIFGLSIEPNMVAQTIRVNYSETNEERKYIKSIYNTTIEKLIETKNEEFKKLILQLEDNISNEHKKMFIESVAISDKGIVERMFPELIEKIDSDGLINLNQFKVISSGLYEYNNFIIYAHRFFRRGCSINNTLNTQLLSKLEYLSINTKKLTNVKIKIDLDMIGLLDSYTCIKEYQYIWGPKFNDDLNKIANGITEHAIKEDEKQISSYDKVEFYWDSKKDDKTFQCEEITNDNFNHHKEFFRNRYVHSIIKFNEETPFHLDGAIREYNIDNYLVRINKKISDDMNDSIRYIKLWRLDGNIEVNIWKDLISSFYAENKLVGEYFGGIDTKLQTVKSPIKNLYLLNNLIVHIRFLENINELHTMIADEFIDRIGKINIQNNKYINFPAILCSKKEDINKIENKFLKLLQCIVNDIHISYSIIALYNGEYVLYSFAGLVKDFNYFFQKNNYIHIPNNKDGINDYIENLYKYMCNNYKKRDSKILNYLTYEGILRV